jgi:2-polyprenyl-3-methyl-5-hydroxy-6-metoxy-1,4-benzoquinol methylase
VGIARRAARRLGLPPRSLWPYALPGAPAYAEASWRRRLRRAPVVPFQQHAEAAGVGEIEEPLACTLCGEARVQPLLHPWAGRSGRRSGRRYHVVRCPGCGLLYRNPGIRPERLGDLYTGNYGRFLTGGYARSRRRRYRLVLDALAPVFDDGAGRRLLDFGCGAGLFLELAHARGFDGYGVDLSADSIARARQRPGGSNTYVGAPLEVPEIAAGGFDVVTLWSVMAHLAEPLADLRMLRGLLAPDGVLLILTVNANSLLLKAQGAAWGGFTPNHLKFFAPATLTRALHAAGFAAAVIQPTYSDGVEAGTVSLRPRHERRLRRVIDDGNRGNMLRALAFNSSDGPLRWGLESGAQARRPDQATRRRTS